MKPRSRSWLVAMLYCWFGTTLAAEPPSSEPLTVIRGAESIGGPMPAVALDVDLRELPSPPEWRPGDPIREVPRRSYPPAGPGAPATRFPDDPLLARQADPPEPNTRAFDVPVLNIDGQNFTGVTPPDTVGDVGPNHYIQAVNAGSGSSVRVYDKAGNILATFSMASLGAPAPCNDGFGDPIVLYDHLANRWFLAEFAGDLSNNLCIYVSQTADPVSGGWFAYRLTTPNFPDYPKFAVWPDAYYMSANEGEPPPAYAINRAPMLAGTPTTALRFSASSGLVFGFEALTPADLDGAAPPTGAPGIFMRHRDDEATPPTTGSDFLDLWEFHADFATPANATFTQLPSIAVSEFSSELCGFQSFNCFPQPGSGTTLDPLREVVMWRLAYRNFGTHQALVGNFVTDADGEGGGDPIERGGVRWFELRKTTGAWTLQQEGTHSPDVNPRWMGAIAMDGSGDIAVGYNVTSSTTVFPSLRYAGRLAEDAPGALRAEVSLVAGAAANSSNRYGDYSAMSVDPSDDCTFWFTGEYNPTSQWRTRIGAFKFDSCGLEPTALSVDAAGNGVLEPSQTAMIAPTWRNRTALTQSSVTGEATAFAGPAGGSYVINDSAAAYGSIAAGASASCGTACYFMTAAGSPRPQLHWDSSFLETLSTGHTKTWTLHLGNSFTDVPASNPFYPFVETLLHKGVTGGCGTDTYCPTSPTTREQMAVFVLIAKEGAGYTPAACSPPNLFTDVPETSPFCRFIEELSNRGVVSGCGTGLYCPTSPVTREQMAIFVLLTLDPTMNPPACSPPNIFADVPETSPFCRWIEELSNRGVVSGCGGGNYCPADPVSRDQMGVFLGVTFSLALYGV